MKGTNFHGLPFQLLLVLKLFLACFAAAFLILFNRPWVESFMHENYLPPTKSLQLAIATCKMGKPIQDEYQNIPLEERSLLYDDWMLSDKLGLATPGILLSTDFSLFSRRAERTIICGSPEQRIKALLFFELSGDKNTIPILTMAQKWAQRRKLIELADEIDKTIVALKSL